jgi:arginine/serine-rich splicing factor 1/9
LYLIGCRIYVGNLPSDVRERELDDLFYKFGRIRDISIKGGTSGPSFAFIEFDDGRDAEDAIRGRDGYDFDRSRIRVEMAGRPKGGGGDDRRGGGGSTLGGRHEHRVVVTGLPKTASWQDLKDFLRAAGDVTFTDVRNGEGVAEFSNAGDMENALRKLDDTEMKSHFGDAAFVRVKKEGGGGDRSRSPKRSPKRSRSPKQSRSRSPKRSHSPKQSRSRSPKRSDSRGRRKDSRSRSPKRSD